MNEGEDSGLEQEGVGEGYAPIYMDRIITDAEVSRSQTLSRLRHRIEQSTPLTLAERQSIGDFVLVQMRK